MTLDFVLVILLVSLLATRCSWQSEGLKRGCGKTTGYLQSVIALITRESQARLRSVNTVDYTAIITLLCQLCLSGGNRRVCVFIRRIVGSLTVIIAIVAFVNVRVILVRIIIVRVVIVLITVWVPRESEIEDEPRAVDKTTAVAMPEMVAIPVPIAMPIG